MFDKVVMQGDYAQYTVEMLLDAIQRGDVAALDYFVTNQSVLKHLAGKHDQSTHGHGKGLPEKLDINVSSEEFHNYLAAKYDLKALNAERDRKYNEYMGERETLRQRITAGKSIDQVTDEEWQPISDLEKKYKDWVNSQPHQVEINKWAENRFSLSVEGEKPSEWNKARAAWVINDKDTLKRQRALRAGKEPTATDLEIDRMVNSGKVLRDTEVYRAAVLPPKMADKLNAGFSWVDKGFLATDLSSSNPLFYVRHESTRGYNPTHPRVLMRGVLKAGSVGVNVGYGEIVLPRNTNVTVLNRDVALDGTILLDVEYDTHG